MIARFRRALWATGIVAGLVWVLGCGQAPVRSRTTSDPVEDSQADEDSGAPFVDAADYQPKSFAVRVTGRGRAVIFIPGLGCPGEVWDDTAAHFADRIQSHVLTLAGFAGQPPIKPPLSAKVRRDLVRYIRSRKLERPIVVGHSMGGFIAYWLAITAPDVIGGLIVVDAGPALGSRDLETARALRNTWAQAGDDELPEQVRSKFIGMTTHPKHIAPYLAAIAKSSRQSIGDAIYELVTTDLRPKLGAIQAPLLLILADGSLQNRYKTMAEPVAKREVVVIPKAGHFVMLDNPEAFYDALATFFDAT